MHIKRGQNKYCIFKFEIMKKLFEKIFCLHKWKSHVKDSCLQETVYPFGSVHKKSFVREVLICEVCGKIKIIEY